MKKLITISVLLALVVALGAAEIYVDTIKYGAIEKKLDALSECIEKTIGDALSADARRLYDDAYEEWEKCDDLFLTITNHNVVRSVGEKFLYLGAYIRADAVSDAYAAAAAISGVLKEVKREKYPLLGNIF